MYGHRLFKSASDSHILSNVDPALPIRRKILSPVFFLLFLGSLATYVTTDLELTAFVAGSLFDGTTIQLPLADGACETSS